MNRRNFMSRCAACAACMSVAPLTLANPLPAKTKAGGKMRIKILYSLHAVVQVQPDWPNVGYDFKPAMDQINATLANHFPDFEFLPALATGPEDAARIVDADKSGSIDGYIVYQMNCWNQVIQTAAKTGKPVLYADFQFAGSGGFLVYNAQFLSEKSQNVGFVASSRMEDLVTAVSCFTIVKNGGSTADFVAATNKIRLGSTPGCGQLFGAGK